jgi:branched-chain amino acid transport system substrate-binding protein
MNQIGYKPKLLAQSDITDDSFLSEYGPSVEGMTVPTKVAPFSSKDPMVQKFVTNYTKSTGKAPSMWNAVGYTQALVTIKALQDTKALTRDCFELALETMKDFKTGLIPPVTFGPDSRQGTNAVGVARIENGKAVEVAPFQTVSGQ